MFSNLGNLNTNLIMCKFTSVKDEGSNDCVNSDDLIEKELEIKLDITKKSRRINRPVQFADQHGEAGGQVAGGHGDLPHCAGHIMEEVKSDSELQAQYIARNPVSRVIQCAAVQSENEVSAGCRHAHSINDFLKTVCACRSIQLEQTSYLKE